MESQKSKKSSNEEPKRSDSVSNQIEKRFWLHIGFPKTGTTSIQAVLTQASDHIINSGHWYPRLAGFKNRQRIANSHHSIFRALTLPAPDDNLSERQIADADLAATIERFSNDPQVLQLIISHESFLENVQPNFELLRQLTSSQPSSIIAYVRCYDQWIESRYTQYVKESRSQIRPLKKFYLGKLEPNFFSRKLQVFRDQLPNCQFVVRSLDASRSNGLTEDFLMQTGIQNDSVLQSLIAAKGTSNRGRLPIVSFFKAYATAGPDGIELAGIIEQALNAIGDEIAKVPFADKRFRFLSHKLKRRARRLYQQEVEQLRDQFDAQIPDPGSLSASDLSYATRLTKREYEQTLDFLRPYLNSSSANRLQAAFAPGAKVMDGSKWRFWRRFFG